MPRVFENENAHAGSSKSKTRTRQVFVDIKTRVGGLSHGNSRATRPLPGSPSRLAHVTRRARARRRNGDVSAPCRLGST